jgi:hypothetical protein
VRHGQSSSRGCLKLRLADPASLLKPCAVCRLALRVTDGKLVDGVIYLWFAAGTG